MVHCCVTDCYNDSRNIPQDKRITFHAFPIVPFLKLQWQQAVGMQPSKLKKTSTICSEHFHPDDLYENACGIRRVKFGGVPTLTKMVPINDDEDLTEVKVCRICLTSETKLYSIQKCNLEKHYELLTGIMMSDGLPQHVCVECARKLRNFHLLRSKSIKSHTILMEMGARHRIITRKLLKSIDREEMGLATTLKANYFDSYTIKLKYDEKEQNNELVFHPIQNITLEEEPEIKHEFVNEDDETDLLKSEESGVEEIYDNNDTVALNNSSDENSRNSPITVKDEQSYDPQTKEAQILKIEGNENVIDVYHTFVKDEFSSDDNEPLQRKVTKRKSKLDKSERSRSAKKVRKRVVPRVSSPVTRARRPKQGPSDRLNHLLFTVTELSFEQQREAVLMRQESANFKNSPYKCNVCYKGFKDLDAYNRHMTYHSNKMGAYECDVCNTHFSNSHAMYKHKEARHLRKYHCKQCSFVTTNRQATRYHEKWHKGKKYACPQCSEEFEKCTSYLSHLRIKHRSDYICDLCGYTFVSTKGLDLHKQLKHRLDSKKIPVDGPYCELCAVRFASMEAYDKHLDMAAKHNVDDDEAASSNSLCEYVCVSCGHTFVNRGALSYHRRVRHNDNGDGSETTQAGVLCQVCDIAFDTQEAFDNHVKYSSKHDGVQRRCRKGEGSKAQEYICACCGETFANRGALGCHKRLRHFEDMQVTENGVNCDECEVVFASQAAFDNHLKLSLRHNGKSNSSQVQKCHRRRRRNPQEDSSEPRKKRPKVERRKVDKPPAVPASFYCEQCELTFKNNLTYYRHMMQVHPDKYAAKRSNLKHMCEICGKQYRSECLLRDHITVHSETKQFKCSQCDKRFHRKYRLQVHFHMIHGNKPKPSLACDVCGKSFTTAFNLQRHQLVHSGLKPFECETCGKCFRQSNERSAHIAHVHMKKPWPKRNRKMDRQPPLHPQGIPDIPGIVPTMWPPRQM